MLYWKLAWQSIVKNKLEYLPFMLAGTAAVALNLVIQLLIYSKGVQTLRASSSVIELLMFGQIVIGLLSVIFLLYTYSFLNKRKQSEFGLFSILGMQKRDLIKISWRQQLINYMIVTVIGVVTGVLFSKLLLLLFIKLVGGNNFQLNIALGAIIFVTIFFGLGFMLLLLSDILVIWRLKTISLLQASQKGDREPKSHWLLFGLGIVLMGWGYYISLTVNSPLKAMRIFFLAVIMVVIATYLLFIVASTIVLKTMKKHTNYYYQTDHFITVSNMLFRMRQNATGLASISLLTTMALVVIVTTVSMFVGQQDYVNKQFPRDVMMTNVANQSISENKVKQAAADNNVVLSKMYHMEISNPITGYLTSSGHAMPLSGTTVTRADNLSDFLFMTIQQFNQLTNQHGGTLAANEVYAYDRQGTFKNNTIKFLNQSYHVKKHLSKIDGVPSMQASMTHSMIIVIPSKTVTDKIGSAFNDLGENKQSISYTNQLLFDIKGSDKQKDKFLKTFKGEQNIIVDSKSETMSVLKSFYGGFFFIGLIFSISFIMATGLIIYYKQISEGRSDKKQFDILQKVGMSHSEVKRTVKSQVVWVFGLPIVVAITHLCFAMPMINKILQIFGVTIGPVVYTTMALTIAGVVLIYFGIYLKTSKTYFKQVARKN